MSISKENPKVTSDEASLNSTLDELQQGSLKELLDSCGSIRRFPE